MVANSEQTNKGSLSQHTTKLLNSSPDEAVGDTSLHGYKKQLDKLM